MKVALVHDYIKEYGGAERVLEALHAIYPDATVFTSLYLPEYLGPHKERFKDWKIRTTWLQYIPFKAKLISPVRLLAPLAFKSFDFSDFDVIIVSATGAYFPNSIRAKGKEQRAKSKENATPSALRSSPIHICYCHTPPRYLYGYATAREWKKNPVLNVVGEVMNHVLRMVDFKSAQNVDYFLANSEEVKRRIQKFYRKEATVVYPPVKTKILGDKDIRIPSEQQKKSPNIIISQSPNLYYVAGGRLARPKHIDLIVRTATVMKLPLKVFGKAFAGYGEELRQIAKGPHKGDPSDKGQRGEGAIEFLGEVSDEEKYKLLAGASAYIFASEDEDFGILPVEAMAQGTPVIAYKSGGVQETVIDQKTGLFFEELTVKSLKEVIEKFEKMSFSSEVCMSRAEEFSEATFQNKIKAFVNSAVQNRINKFSS